MVVPHGLDRDASERRHLTDHELVHGELMDRLLARGSGLPDRLRDRPEVLAQ